VHLHLTCLHAPLPLPPAWIRLPGMNRVAAWDLSGTWTENI
jgi:hypothetical protein